MFHYIPKFFFYVSLSLPLSSVLLSPFLSSVLLSSSLSSVWLSLSLFSALPSPHLYEVYGFSYDALSAGLFEQDG